MFTNEHKNQSNIIKSTEKRVFKTGITLANTTSVKRRITYRELTLAFGIVVAMLVAMTLWAKSPAETKTSKVITLPKITAPPAAKSLVSIVIEVIF